MMKYTATFLVLVASAAGCSDSNAPTWPADAKLQLSIDGDAIVAAWPEASDDKGVASYAVSVDGTPTAESGADARNFKAMSVTLGDDHEFSVVAKDISGNTSKPLVAKWEAKDVEGPTWPLGTLLQVRRADTDAEPQANGTVELELNWPAAEDPSGVSFYRVVRVPTEVGGELTRPKLAGLVKDGKRKLLTKGLPSTKFQVFAIDAENNASKPISGALDNPTKLNPLQAVKPLTDEDKIGAGDEPKVDKAAAREKMAAEQ
jgi:hypothetical protein